MPAYPPVLTVPSRSSSDESRSPPAATAAPPSPPRRRGKLPAQTTELLLKWLHAHEDHPYPTDEEKRQLCAMTGLTLTQVCNWMINARRRILAPNSHRHSGRDDAVIPPTWGSSSSPSPPFPSQRDYDLYAAATAMGTSPGGSSRHMAPTWEQLSDNSSSGRSASPSSNTSWTLHQHPYAPSVSPSHRHHHQQPPHHHSPSPYHSHTPHLPHTHHHDQLSAYAASAAAAVAAAAAQHHGGGHNGAFDFHGLDSSHLLFTPDSISPLDPAYAQYFQQAGTQQSYAHWNSTN